MSDPIFFWGGIYSQWHRSPFTIDEVFYRTAEHWMMAEKARLFGDDAALEAILKTRDPSDAKAIGRQIKGWSENIWQLTRFQVVCRGSYEKFRQNPELLRELIDSGDRQIIEASPYDKVWGIGLGEQDAWRWYLDAANSNHNMVCNGGYSHPVQIEWPGLNLLGKAIMAARTMLSPQ